MAGQLYPSDDIILLQKQWSTDLGGQLVISTTPSKPFYGLNKNMKGTCKYKNHCTGSFAEQTVPMAYISHL